MHGGSPLTGLLLTSYSVDYRRLRETLDRGTRELSAPGEHVLDYRPREVALVGEPPSSKRIIRFGVFELDPAAAELHKQGLKVRLQEKPFQVLTLLLERPGEVVTREELHKRLWPEVSPEVDIEHSLSTAIKKLRDALDDSADNPRFIETRPGRGYRFIAPVEGSLRPTQDVKPPKVALEKPVAEQPSVAVLPFADMSPEKNQDYFCDGMTEEIINALTNARWIRVVSRTSVFQYKGKPEDIRKIGAELNVSTVVEGSVRKAGNRLRITAQLTNVTDGYHLWSETYDRKLQDVFAIQEEIAVAVLSKLVESSNIRRDPRPFGSAQGKPATGCSGAGSRLPIEIRAGGG